VELGNLAQSGLRRAVAFVQTHLTEREAQLQAQREAQQQARTRSQRVYHKLGLLHAGELFENPHVHEEILRAAQLHVLTLLTEYDYR
jgi:hypothetical protein